MEKINISKRTFLAVIAALAVGLLLGWLLFGVTDESSTRKHDHDSMSASETIWTCSMHPQIRRKEPGKCPICGMELIPLDPSEEGLDNMAVSLSPTAMQLAQVQTTIVGQGRLEKSVRLNGKVQTDERSLFTQSSHIPGRVERLTVNFTGDFVSKGQVIAYIYSPQLVTAQEELFEAKKIKETQPELFNAAKEKLKNWKLTEKQIEQIVASKKSLEEFPILANVSGYVTKKMVNLGDYIKQGEAIYEIADLSKVWILFDVYESDMAWIKKGATVSYTVQSIPGKTFTGTISYIDPVINPKTRVAKARIEVSNKDLLLKPEMFVSGTVVANTSSGNKTSLIVPKTAVMWTGKRSVVYVMYTSDKGINFRMREVTLGPALEDSYVIESGLEVGEEIASNGTFSIDAAAQLAGKPSMMNPEGGVAMTGHNHGAGTNEQMINRSDTTKKSVVLAETKKALQPLFDNYFSMKAALASDDFEKAKKAGISMSSVLGKIDQSLFTGGVVQSHWLNLSTGLKRHLQHIEHLEDLEAIRENFQGISNAMIALAESFDPISRTIYVQHCPMADSNKGAYWLSAEKEIRNPYFGSTMLSCGENTKTIP